MRALCIDLLHKIIFYITFYVKRGSCFSTETPTSNLGKAAGQSGIGQIVLILEHSVADSEQAMNVGVRGKEEG